MLKDFKSTCEKALNESGDPPAELDRLKDTISRLPASQLITIEVNSEDEDGKVIRYFAYNRDFQRMRENLSKKGLIGIKHVADADGGITTSTISGPAKRDHVEPSASIAWVLKELDSRRESLLKAWGQGMIKLCAEIRTRTDLDGLLKEELIYHLLQACANGSTSMREKLAAPLSALQRRQQARKSWATPQTPSDALAADVEQGVIAPLAEAFSSLKQSTDELTPATKLEYSWVGFLMQQNGGEIIGHMIQEPDESGEVYVMRRSTENPTQADIIAVGMWENDKITLFPKPENLNAGRPLFFLGRE